MTDATSSVDLKEPCTAPRTVRISDPGLRKNENINYIYYVPQPKQLYFIFLSSFKFVNNVKTFVPYHPQMTLSQRIGVVEINTLWLFRYLQLAKKRTKVVFFFLRLSGTGMTSLILLSPLLKCLMTLCPSSLVRARD